MKKEAFILNVVKTEHDTKRYKATGKITREENGWTKAQWFVLFLDNEFKVVGQGAKTPPPTEEEKALFEEAIKPYRVRALLMKR